MDTGPWIIEYGHMQDQVNIRYWQITDGQDAICCNQFCCASDSEGNANLIAAAPELYEALTLCVKEIEALTRACGSGLLTDNALIAGYSALSKARGEHK